MPKRRVGHQLVRLSQARSAAAMSRARSCVSQVKPSPIVCHDDLIAEARQARALAGLPGALDELHDADPLAAPEQAQRQAERGRRLALAGPVWTMSRPFSIVFYATSASCTALRFAILARWR